MRRDAVDSIVRFVGVYDADGTIAGEAKYLVGKLFGRNHCALCDLTHGTNLKGRNDFKACAESLPIPFDLFHRNDQPDSIRTLTDKALPCIVGETANGSLRIAVTSQQLEQCQNDVGQLEALLRQVLE
jgi:hypothetical protein